MNTSFKPDVEFELFKLILLRESYVKRLTKQLVEGNGAVEISLVGVIDVLRDTSVQVVLSIRIWERAQLTYPQQVQPFLWNGKSYLHKMLEDMNFLDSYPEMQSWLRFSLLGNPFIVPPELLTDEVKLSDRSYVVFGQRPQKQAVSKASDKKNTFLKSPYLTPIINDPQIFTHLSVKNQLDKQFKGAAKDSAPGSQSVNADYVADPFESTLSYEQVATVRKCWKILSKSNYPQMESLSQSQRSLLSVGSAPSSPDKLRAVTARSRSVRSPATAVETFSDTKEDFQHSMRKSGGLEYPEIEKKNKSLRIFELSENATPTCTKLWTPHDINYQLQVQRRGGELHVLTVAGNTGRMKAPWRRTRFERLAVDHKQISQSCEVISMHLEDIISKAIQKQAIEQAKAPESIVSSDEKSAGKNLEPQPGPKVVFIVDQPDLENIAAIAEAKEEEELRRNFITYQYNHFQMLSQGSLTDIEKLRNMRQLNPGESLEGDQKLSMSLEDRMAHRIQRRVRWRFGQALRRALLRKMNKAAAKIQLMWIRAQTLSLSKSRGTKTRLALILQRLYRSRIAGDSIKQLRLEAKQHISALTLQRVFRGFKGRRRLNLKRELVKNIEDAKHRVSLHELVPGDLDDLADLIEASSKNYSISLPTTVLTILRTILYLLNGSNAECVAISTHGFTENKYIFASSATWKGVMLVLRRKGRFIRRLRALINYVSFPNACMLSFCPEAEKHLDEVINGVSAEDISSLDLEKGKRCVVQLFYYCAHIRRIYQLQALFPEFFEAGQPDWFRTLMRLKWDFDRAETIRRIETACMFRLEHRKRKSVEDGRSWRHVADAVHKNEQALSRAKIQMAKSRVKLNKFIAQLQKREEKKVNMLREIARAQELAVQVAEANLKEYVRVTYVLDDTILKELQYKVDSRKLSLLITKADLSIHLELSKTNADMRDFDKLMNFGRIFEICSEAGTVLADLMVLLNDWRKLLVSIGGVQYIKDLKGKRKLFYENLRADSILFMERRNKLRKDIDAELRSQHKLTVEAAIAVAIIARSKPWDNPTQIEVEAEGEENSECCRRDADFEVRQKRQMQYVDIPSIPFKPSLVIVDSSIPRSIRAEMGRLLAEYSFTALSTVGRKHADKEDGSLLYDIQKLFDAKKHVLLFVDRGIHALKRAAFLAGFNATLAGLVPRPNVISVDCLLTIRMEDWFSLLSPESEAFLIPDPMDSNLCVVLIAKAKRSAALFKRLHKKEVKYASGTMSPITIASNPSLEQQPSLDSKFDRDLSDFMRSLFSVPTKQSNPSDEPDKKGETSISFAQECDLLLAATISCILQLWEAPLSEWKSRDLRKGSKLFSESFAHDGWVSLITVLSLQSFSENGLQKSNLLHSERLRQSEEFVEHWQYLHKLQFHAQPARWILKEWVSYIKELIFRITIHGGIATKEFVDSEFKAFGNAPRQLFFLDWEKDVFCNQPAVELVGNILYSCFFDSMIFERKDAAVKYYYDRGNLASLEKQCIGMKTLNQQHVCVFQVYDEAIVAVKGQDLSHSFEGTELNLKVNRSWNYFTKIKLKDIVSALQPSSTEIFEGRVRKYNISSSGSDKWPELLTQWTCLESLSLGGVRVDGSILRSRYLILSKLGTISGFFLRLEIFEERYGELRILVYGLTDNGAMDFKVDKAQIFLLASRCDAYVEQQSLANMETQAIAYIFSDRLEVRPSKGWQNFLNSGELLPKRAAHEVKLITRRRRGPGHFVGRRIIYINGVQTIITLFELDNDTNSNELRIVVYETAHHQTVEYRLSPLERLTLFRDGETLISQIISRLRVVFCNVVDDKFNGLYGRSLLVLDSNSQPEISNFEMEGKEEYDIVLKDEFSPYEDSDDKSDDKDDKDHGEEENAAASESDENNIATMKQQWKSPCQWAMYFDRSLVEEQKGNLVVSVTLSVTQKGLIFTTRDLRTMREAYKYISFLDACEKRIIDNDLKSFLGELDNLDESVAFDVVDDLVQRIDLQDSDESGLVMIITSETDNENDVILANLIEHVPVENEFKALKKKKLPVHNVEIKIHSAKGLNPVSSVLQRNPLCIVKWNMRELGRSSIILQTLNPVWENCVFNTLTSRDVVLEQSSLDIEVWDTDLKDTVHFLGCIHLQGDELVSFLQNSDDLSMDLKPSKRLADSENIYVGGAVQITGSAKVLHSDDEPIPEAFALAMPQKTQDEVMSKEEEIFISIMYVDGISMGLDLHCNIRWNGNLMRTIAGVAGMNGVVDFYDESCSLKIPANYPLGGCNLEIELTVGDSTVPVLYLCIRGSALTQFVVTPLAMQPGQPGTHGAWYSLERIGQIPTAKLTIGKKIPRIQLFASQKSVRQFKYSLQIPSARNLAKQDLFGSRSDPYIKVYFNGRLLGQTSTLKSTSNPDWTAEEGAENLKSFPFTVPRWLDIRDCHLEVEVYGITADAKSSKTDFLGCRSFVGEELYTLLNSSQDKQTTWLDLRKSNKPTLSKSTIQPKGDVSLKITPLHHGLTNDVDDIDISADDSEKKANFNSRISIYEFTHNLRAEVLQIKFISLTNMFVPPNTSELIIEAAVNGRSIGETAAITDFEMNSSNQLLFIRNNTNNVFRCTLPFGLDLESCALDLSVLAKVAGVAKKKRFLQMSSKDSSSEAHYVAIATSSLSSQKWLSLMESKVASESNIDISRFTSMSLPLTVSKDVAQKNASNTSSEINIAAVFIQPAKKLQVSRQAISSKVLLEEVTNFLAEQGKLSFTISDAMLNDAALKKMKVVAAQSLKVPTKVNDALYRVPKAQLHLPVVIIVSWNRQEVKRFFGDIKSLNNIMWYQSETDSLTSKLKIEVSLPGDYAVQSCHLEIQLFINSVPFDTMVLTEGLFDRFQVSNHDSLQFIELSNKMVRFNFGYSIIPSSSMLLQQQLEKFSDHRREKKNGKLVRISTPLAEDDCPWRALFVPQLAASTTKQNNRMIKNKETALERRMRLLNVTKLVIWDTDNEPIFDRNPQNVNISRTELHRQFQMELAPITFTATTKAQESDEYRAIWRGRVMPRNFIGSTVSVMKAVMQTRSSRLIRTKNISELKVLTEVHHLVDMGEESQQVSPHLPICIKEVCSQGPGIVTARLRVEVFANNGVMLGSTDFEEDETTFRRVVGAKFAATHLTGPRKTWNMAAIYEHIILDRLLLDMTPRESKQQLKPAEGGGRRAAVTMTSGGGVLDLSTSLVSLIRDPEPDVSPSRSVDPVDEGESKSSVSEEKKEPVRKVFWLRLHSRTHRLLGRPLRTVVLVQGDDTTLRNMDEEPDTFFLVAPVDPDFFSKVDFVFKSKDALTKKTFMCNITGVELLRWLPKDLFIDFKTKFRRNKFGSYLAQYLAMRFVSKDGIELYLLTATNRAAEQDAQDTEDKITPPSEAAIASVSSISRADERSLTSTLPPEDQLPESSVKSVARQPAPPQIQQSDNPTEVLESGLVGVDTQYNEDGSNGHAQPQVNTVVEASASSSIDEKSKQAAEQSLQ